MDTELLNAILVLSTKSQHQLPYAFAEGTKKIWLKEVILTGTGIVGTKFLMKRQIE